MFGPEDKIRGAQSALAKAHQKFEAAIAFTNNESKRQAQEIDSLTSVIATKRDRANELDVLSDKAGKAYTAIADLLVD